jgi:hypothetical protein
VNIAETNILFSFSNIAFKISCFEILIWNKQQFDTVKQMLVTTLGENVGYSTAKQIDTFKQIFCFDH